jgi:hypothetical protein
MRHAITGLWLLALAACSPESIMTPDECKIEKARKEVTLSIGAPGDTVAAETKYRVTVEDGRVFEITEAEAIAAQADPVAACRELRVRN